MPTYRFYWFGGDGHIKGAENIDCTNDADALLVGKQNIGEFPAIEIWLGTTRVARLSNNADSDGDVGGM